MTALERLEVTHGLAPRTTADAEAVRCKAIERPQDLTDVDLAVLAYFGPGREAQDAIDAYVRSRKATATPPAAAPGPVYADGLALKGVNFTTAEILGPVLKKLNTLEARINALEAENAALKAELNARPTMRYVGVWKAEVAYGLGDFATHHGSLWSSLRGVNYTEPGTADAWQLAVKKGRDGKDGKDAPRQLR